MPSIVRVNDRPIPAKGLLERVLKTINSGGVYLYSGTERLENLKQLTPELESMGLRVKIYSHGAIVSQPDFTPAPKQIAMLEAKL